MRLKNVLIAVKDIEKSKGFYKDLFGLNVVLEQEGNVILTEGLVLQDAKIWEQHLQKRITWENHSMELYFEETDLVAFRKKLEEYPEKIKFIVSQEETGENYVRFYDPDGTLIEVRSITYLK